MSEKDDAQILLNALPLKKGDVFTHYKRGGAYEIITLAVKEDTLTPLVVYRSVENDSVWVRTYENFIEEVEYDGRKTKRFIPV